MLTYLTLLIYEEEEETDYEESRYVSWAFQMTGILAKKAQKSFASASKF